MSGNKGEELEEPMLCAPVAKVLLLMTGRAVEDGDDLVPTQEEPDSITEGAMLVYETGRPSLLSRAIEEATDRASQLSPAVLGRFVSDALTERREQLLAEAV